MWNRTSLPSFCLQVLGCFFFLALSLTEAEHNEYKSAIVINTEVPKVKFTYGAFSLNRIKVLPWQQEKKKKKSVGEKTNARSSYTYLEIRPQVSLAFTLLPAFRNVSLCTGSEQSAWQAWNSAKNTTQVLVVNIAYLPSTNQPGTHLRWSIRTWRWEAMP